MDQLIKWQEKYYHDKSEYDIVLQNIDDNESAYFGTRPIMRSDGKTKAKKQAATVRKLAFELIESQVDVVIPMPKVISKRGRTDRAQMIENMLRNEINKTTFKEIIDEQSRTTPTTGSSIFYGEWDNSETTIDSVGDILVKNLHPKQVIPQAGVFKLKEMDYCFVDFEQTKKFVKDTYGVDVDLVGDENEDGQPYEHMVTHHFVYYRNQKGGIGLYSWAGNTEIQNFENYFARQQLICKKCGTEKDLDVDKCIKCGSKKFVKSDLEMQEMTVVNQETGTQEKVKVPYYVPDEFPIVIRKNVSLINRFMGSSDVDYIKDQQNDTTIYLNKMREKVLKGGSFVTLPNDLDFDADDDELKILRLTSPEQRSMIDVRTIQPDITKESALIDLQYEIARQTLGITDSFQGRRDSTATSGVAKQFAAQQTAGRLESKKQMKELAFSDLYRMIFKFKLAFADEPRSFVQQDENGNTEVGYFDKRMFIDQDDQGNFYYDDDFIITTDISGTLANDRQAMWQETRSNFESGSYGDPTDINTLIMYWQMMNGLHYPGSEQALQFLQVRKQEQDQMMAAQIEQEQLQAQPQVPPDNTADVVNSTLQSLGG